MRGEQTLNKQESSLSFFRSGYGGERNLTSGLQCPARVGQTLLGTPRDFRVGASLWGPKQKM